MNDDDIEKGFRLHRDDCNDDTATSLTTASPPPSWSRRCPRPSREGNQPKKNSSTLNYYDDCEEGDTESYSSSSSSLSSSTSSTSSDVLSLSDVSIPSAAVLAKIEIEKDFRYANDDDTNEDDTDSYMTTPDRTISLYNFDENEPTKRRKRCKQSRLFQSCTQAMLRFFLVSVWIWIAWSFFQKIQKHHDHQRYPHHPQQPGQEAIILQHDQQQRQEGQHHPWDEINAIVENMILEHLDPQVENDSLSTTATVPDGTSTTTKDVVTSNTDGTSTTYSYTTTTMTITIEATVTTTTTKRISSPADDSSSSATSNTQNLDIYKESLDDADTDELDDTEDHGPTISSSVTRVILDHGTPVEIKKKNESVNEREKRNIQQTNREPSV